MTEQPDSAKTNLDLLIKLMGMTTSANDSEALVAMRKANVVLQKFGGNWRDLLFGKVKIIEDPFANMDMGTRQVREPEQQRAAPPPPPPPPPPQPSWAQQYQANPQTYQKPRKAPRPKRAKGPRYSSLDSLA